MSSVNQPRWDTDALVGTNLGILYYHLPQSDDRGSVLYRNILGPGDLDRVSEDF